MVKISKGKEDVIRGTLAFMSNITRSKKKPDKRYICNPLAMLPYKRQLHQMEHDATKADYIVK